MADERWKELPGWPYSVSNTGRVRNDRTGLILRPSIVRGYCRVTLCLNGKQKARKVHHLVLESFGGERSGRRVCNHKNGDRKDNRIENLEWVTQADNIRHAMKNGFHDFKGEANPRSTLTRRKVAGILKRLPGFGEVLPLRKAKELAAYGGVKPHHIYKIHAGKGWAHMQRDRIRPAREIEGGEHG